MPRNARIRGIFRYDPVSGHTSLRDAIPGIGPLKPVGVYSSAVHHYTVGLPAVTGRWGKVVLMNLGVVWGSPLLRRSSPAWHAFFQGTLHPVGPTLAIARPMPALGTLLASLPKARFFPALVTRT